jgi:hypothetical protein
MFKKFDTDGNGTLSMMELECAFAVLGINFEYENIRRFIYLTDTNKDGKISYQELQHIIFADTIDEIIIEEQMEVVSSDDDENVIREEAIEESYTLQED